eukprot:TRINITY_DN4175_c0_g3_i2.p2 TRINITY_DN4175_c0_g3~~TRINITY_DN4175_c0_g3_i2.p2  ORF type:complete len:100 (+),score=5.73 TRINITY_DN4175_c0_g3_i2:195-494(+)
MENIRSHASPQVERILVANKIDMAHRKIPSQRGQETADEFKMMYVESSAKNNVGIQEIFESLTRNILKHRQPQELAPPVNTVPVQPQPEPQSTSCCEKS